MNSFDFNFLDSPLCNPLICTIVDSDYSRLGLLAHMSPRPRLDEESSLLPGGSGLLGTKRKARGGGSVIPDLVMSVGYLTSLSACPCLRLPSCEMKIHAPPSRVGVRQEEGMLEVDMQGHIWKV